MPRTLRRPFIAIAVMILLVTLAAPTAQADGPAPLRDGCNALWNWLLTSGVLGYSSTRDAAAAPIEAARLSYSGAVDPNGATLAAEPEPPVPQAAPDDSGDR